MNGLRQAALTIGVLTTLSTAISVINGQQVLGNLSITFFLIELLNLVISAYVYVFIIISIFTENSFSYDDK
ncbi:hypothetical protein A0J48_025535 [Sphaerospermopsis aphanizomenoides BCCUSP55]|uniref:hypothetical protein n=1 Tax=Sphaerospermopsis aphanizomenoides TaxID=459663 RepID=UPI0019072878|nr:hypothetical protein [Sphaerospermopsis aphanizomenoides]MBK1990829.1 hypothetical protein [Sphaerospermopsis aphanizomenoides BCCUSP55]